ncbi:MarR family winged helix-turn-helix transcriptional regulator [Hyphomicrobium sp.]|jgi:DNA-binding MarR family transcriptional regulator|uniref:MarR family winged helix-turn-helix transcriptional regulator n=1 Tax=Hyphomicrobium sp. TaxID=82 RepID=UPI0035626675
MDRQLKTSDSPNPLRILGHAYRTFSRIVDAQLRELGLAMSQLPVLIVLKQGKPLPQAELARIARVEQPSMAQLLNRMERDGLVERLADPEDKRSRLISLTERASRRMHKGKAIMEATVNIALQGFSTAEIEQLDKLMQRIDENLERAAEEGHY